MKINWRNVAIILSVGVIGFVLGVIVTFQLALKNGIVI
jgi:hypothetical protein